MLAEAAKTLEKIGDKRRLQDCYTLMKSLGTGVSSYGQEEDQQQGGLGWEMTNNGVDVEVWVDITILIKLGVREM